MVTTRAWLMQTMPELVDAAGPDPASARAHCVAVAAAIERCVSLRRFDDALRLSDWLVDLYVPRGDELSWQTIMGTSALCADLGADPELNGRAIESLRRAVAAAPRRAGTEVQLAVCGALTDLSTLYTTCRTTDDRRHRTRESIAICDDIVARWSGSQDSWLRLNVAGAMLNKAMSLLELGDEPAARREYTRVVESCTADAEQDGEARDKFGSRLLVARHALEILDSLRLPDPEFNTGHLDAAKRRQRRRYLDAARRLHRGTADFVRRTSCIGEPWVLVLRNFELTYTAVVRHSEDGPEHIQIAKSPVGLSVLNDLFEAADVVQVANTNAAALDLVTDTASFMGHRTTPRTLYLPETGWLDTVRVLVGLAERVVVWAGEKTPPLLAELALVTELGRTQDAIVLLDEIPHPHGFPDVPPPGEPLTADDPVLAGFPAVVQARTVNAESFLRDLTSSIAAAQQLPMHERVARIRRRMGASGQ